MHEHTPLLKLSTDCIYILYKKKKHEVMKAILTRSGPTRTFQNKLTTSTNKQTKKQTKKKHKQTNKLALISILTKNYYSCKEQFTDDSIDWISAQSVEVPIIPKK